MRKVWFSAFILIVLVVSLSGCGPKKPPLKEAAEELARKRAILEARNQFEDATYKKLPDLYAEVTADGKIAALMFGLDKKEMERITKRRRVVRLNDLAPMWDTRTVLCRVCVGQKAMEVNSVLDPGWLKPPIDFPAQRVCVDDPLLFRHVIKERDKGTSLLTAPFVTLFTLSKKQYDRNVAFCMRYKHLEVGFDDLAYTEWAKKLLPERDRIMEDWKPFWEKLEATKTCGDVSALAAEYLGHEPAFVIYGSERKKKLFYGRVVKNREPYRKPTWFLKKAVVGRIYGKVEPADFRKVLGKLAGFVLVQCLERSDELLVHNCIARNVLSSDPARVCRPEKITRETWRFDSIYERGDFLKKWGLTMSGKLSYEFWPNGTPKFADNVYYIIE